MVFSATSDSPQRVGASLDIFSLPASVAVVGASPDPAKWGHWLATGALTGTGRRPVYLVNRSSAEIAGVQSYAALSELPQVPELVAIAVPGAHTLGVIREALELGSRAFVVVSAQLECEKEVVKLLTEYGARMVGPNSLGIYSAEGQLQLMWGGMHPGSLAIVSQSGQLGSEIATIGARNGLGVSRFVSLGNQIDVRAAEVVRSIISDDQTKTIGLYLEDFSEAQDIFAACREAVSAGKHVLLLATGESDASQQLAQSHTGAMTSPMDLVDAACRAAGVLRVRTPAQLVQIASYAEHREAPKSARVAIISDSGGQGGIAADEAARLGLQVPQLSDQLQELLRGILPANASTRNPIDLAGAGEANLSVYAELPRLLAESGEVDAVVVSGYFCGYGHDAPQLLDAEMAVADSLAAVGGAPTLVHAMAPDSELAQKLRDAGVPVAGRIEDILFVIASAQKLGRPLPQPVADGIPVNGSNQVEIRKALAKLSVPFPDMQVVRSAGEAAAAAANLGGTVVLKAAWLEHKTEVGGVMLGLSGPDAAREAFAQMHARLGDGEYTVERQDTREGVVEFVVAARRDEVFGPVISVGYGGTDTEIWGDLAIELAPVGMADAEAMIASLKSSRLLKPWRGREALDMAGLAGIVSELGRVLAASPGILEIELNPVRVGIEGCLVVDCLAILDTRTKVTTAVLETVH